MKHKPRHNLSQQQWLQTMASEPFEEVRNVLWDMPQICIMTAFLCCSIILSKIHKK
jgi:hypothetical protein